MKTIPKEVHAMANEWYASHPEHVGKIEPEWAAVNQSDVDKNKRVFDAGFLAGQKAAKDELAGRQAATDSDEVISGHDFLDCQLVDLGSEEVKRIHRLGAYRTLLQIRIDDDPNDVELPREDFDAVWSVATSIADAA